MILWVEEWGSLVIAGAALLGMGWAGWVELREWWEEAKK